ncbi:hypothetical protein IEQ34_022108 [Dendrobium chrysotoxum]|uniref:Gnk2-homologous domain-containing protein n=1 Tax=Dendrobium chrysotoxum TaxID=161865 RepID=A0AAV7FY38_DENCH|nr:hypothetical protein IEQ34_022108 [Dendrobium chrysotoxum]
MAIQLLFLLSLFTYPAKADPLYHLCGNSTDIFTSNSTYSSNLNLLFSTLYTNASATGFATFTTGSVPDRTYGLTFCRGDIDIANCSSCISTAISDIEKVCPNNTKGVVWYDFCQLYYSNDDILSNPDVNNSYQYILVNSKSVSANQLLKFEIQTIALMENVSDLVTSNKSRLFATGETAFTAGNIIYGLMQCALDLSASYCRSCLQVLVGTIDLDDRKGRIGRRAMGLWCNMRYELYKFYNGASMLQLSSDQPPSSPSTTNVSKPNGTDLAHGGISFEAVLDYLTQVALVREVVTGVRKVEASNKAGIGVDGRSDAQMQKSGMRLGPGVASFYEIGRLGMCGVRTGKICSLRAVTIRGMESASSG